MDWGWDGLKSLGKECEQGQVVELAKEPGGGGHAAVAAPLLKSYQKSQEKGGGKLGPGAAGRAALSHCCLSKQLP